MNNINQLKDNEKNDFGGVAVEIDVEPKEHHKKGDRGSEFDS